ncbi:hypothetical protein AOC36_02355 [Erysipelothrix larvae]|uniref:Uncharacterized protein n=1 Tax=Erysipelothrix larvae TaxID=1514105 RepID=A0A109UGM0_9FIRM|nr:hypothetical protein [Erysipelothrix larvae]AMC92865.1 hypothetical protein AOC36_02355 [Erysipelothrix larvae]
MKSIYILLTRSKTAVSKMIYQVTQDAYTHVSISFEPSLQPMYSFARKYNYTPLPAGLKDEDLDNGFYKRFENIPCALYELNVDEDVYEKAKAHVESMKLQMDEYRFSLFGLVMCKFNIPYERENYYFCSQFVGEILASCGALDLPKPPTLMRPADYMEFSELKCIFEGDVKRLRTEYRKVEDKDEPSSILNFLRMR